MNIKKAATNVSLESRLMNLVGTALYGPPSKHGLPSDFFYLVEDRTLYDMQTNVLANLTRARLAKFECWLARFLGVALLAIWLVYLLPSLMAIA